MLSLDETQKGVPSSPAASKFHWDEKAFRELAALLPALIENGAIALFGPPAVGKGTTAKWLAALWDIPIIPVGDLLRDRAKVGDAFGLELDAKMERKDFIADEIIFDLIGKELERLGNPKAFILDGCPRTPSQVPLLDEFLKNRGINNLAVLYLEAKLQTCLDRSANRAQETEAKGEKQRGDESKTAGRYEKFEAESKPVAAIYDARGQAVRADCNDPSYLKNAEAIAKVLGPLLKKWSEQNPLDTSFN